MQLSEDEFERVGVAISNIHDGFGLGVLGTVVALAGVIIKLYDRENSLLLLPFGLVLNIAGAWQYGRSARHLPKRFLAWTLLHFGVAMVFLAIATLFWLYSKTLEPYLQSKVGNGILLHFLTYLFGASVLVPPFILARIAWIRCVVYLVNRDPGIVAKEQSLEERLDDPERK